MASTRKRILVSFTPDERVAVNALATQLKLSVSELLRRLVLGHRLPDPNAFAAAEGIRELLKVNADQARLGNLLKLALDESDGHWPPALVARVDTVLAEIGATQAALKLGVAELHRQIHPRAVR